MSTQIKPLIVGLASPGLLWLATSIAFGQDAPAPQGPPTAAPTSPATYRVLLLTSGSVIRGVIIDVPAAKAFCLKGSGGPVPYPKTKVLKAAQTIEELYQFQVQRLPKGDADERIKLAKWCLTEKLDDQAREQLEAVEEMSPGDRTVEKMLYSLSARERPEVDPNVRRSSVDMPRGEVPEQLAPGVIKRSRNFNGIPQIFDLPPAQAVSRFNEFAQYVQPVLQQNCVKCHNERYEGNFQLVETRIRRDRTNSDILRANLDATLSLVNKDDPSRSELLSAGLVPHGGNRNAIFKGPNDQGYVILVTWIKRVRPVESGQKAPAESSGRPGFNGQNPTTGEGFAADRSSRSSGFPSSNASGGFPPLPAQPAIAGMGGQIPQSGASISNYEGSAEFLQTPGENPQFPPPFVAGGAPALPPASPRTRSKAGATGAAPPQTPRALPQNARPIGPNTVQVDPVESLDQLPGMNSPLYPPAQAKETDPKTSNDAPAAEAPKKKPKKIDEILLERMMKARNGGTTTPGTP